jgi:hypothetical protein
VVNPVGLRHTARQEKAFANETSTEWLADAERESPPQPGAKWLSKPRIQAGAAPEPFPLDELPRSGTDSSPVQLPWLGLSGLAARSLHRSSGNALAKPAFAG